MFIIVTRVIITHLWHPWRSSFPLPKLACFFPFSNQIFMAFFASTCMSKILNYYILILCLKLLWVLKTTNKIFYININGNSYNYSEKNYFGHLEKNKRSLEASFSNKNIERWHFEFASKVLLFPVLYKGLATPLLLPVLLPVAI